MYRQRNDMASTYTNLLGIFVHDYLSATIFFIRPNKTIDGTEKSEVKITNVYLLFS